MGEEKIFLVYRDSGNGKLKYQRFKVPLTKGMTVLDALFYIQDHYDSTLAFRYACRGAVCGSCGIIIDKVPSLACKTQALTVKNIRKPLNLPEFNFGNFNNWNPETEILIEPLPNMKVLKDLIVDMNPFWKFYKEVKPYFVKEWNDSPPETLQSPEQMNIIKPLVYCILCGLCWACPINKKNPYYLGPAQLAKSNRFIGDSRISKKAQNSIISRVLKDDAVPACEKFFVCNRVCPKNVMPGTAIKDLREKWLSK
ncbi:MAG: succinate dehydrogenase/fumarate reductase iron-sulfur subunit [Candidatus Thorarchaeota archaeon]